MIECIAPVKFSKLKKLADAGSENRSKVYSGGGAAGEEVVQRTRLSVVRFLNLGPLLTAAEYVWFGRSGMQFYSCKGH